MIKNKHVWIDEDIVSEILNKYFKCKEFSDQIVKEMKDAEIHTSKCDVCEYKQVCTIGSACESDKECDLL